MFEPGELFELARSVAGAFECKLIDGDYGYDPNDKRCEDPRTAFTFRAALQATISGLLLVRTFALGHVDTIQSDHK